MTAPRSDGWRRAGKQRDDCVAPGFGIVICRRYQVSVARLLPPIRFNYCQIVKMGRPLNENLEHFTNLVIDRLRETESPWTR